MQNMKNEEIRTAMREAKLTFRTLAEIMGVSEATVYRMLAADLDERDKDRLLQIVQAYAEGRQVTA